jgi:hypothetical protein
MRIVEVFLLSLPVRQMNDIPQLVNAGRFRPASLKVIVFDDMRDRH